MNPGAPHFSEERRAQTRATLLAEIANEQAQAKAPAKRHRKALILASAGALVFAATGSAYYIATQPVEDKRMIRCYYNADLTTSRFVISDDEGDPGYQLGPYQGAGIEPKPGESDQVQDAIGLCTWYWDGGMMNPLGLTDHLIPEGFKDPYPGRPYDGVNTGLGPGHYVPELTACVVDDEVAIIPGDKNVCARLQIPALAD